MKVVQIVRANIGGQTHGRTMGLKRTSIFGQFLALKILRGGVGMGNLTSLIKHSLYSNFRSPMKKCRGSRPTRL